ncbi:MAG: translation initiation factor IF-2 [Chlamydiota bacterium]
MAKNLKLNIKNTQLAEALKLNKQKKPAPAKKKDTAAPATTEATLQEAHVEHPSVQETPSSLKPKSSSSPKGAPKSETPSADAAAPAQDTAKNRPEAPSQESPVPAPAASKPEIKPEPRPESHPENRPDARSDVRPDTRQGQRPPPTSYGQPRPQQNEYQPRSQQGYPQRPQQNGYPPRPQQNGYPPRQQQNGYPPRPQQNGYPPRPQQNDYQSRPQQQNTGQYPGARPPYRPASPGGTGTGYGNRPGERPQAYRPQQRPYPPRTPTPPTAIPPKHTEKPSTKSHEGPGDTARKPPGFKEYRDLKPQKKSDQRSFDVRDRQGLRVSDDEAWRKKRPAHKARFTSQQEEIIRPKTLSIRLPISIKDLASEMKLKASQLISKLFMQGVVVTLNDLLDDETTIQLLGHEFDCEIKIDTSEEERLRITEKTIKEEVSETPPEQLAFRPPVITFMGHVDHGKTSLIDAIRKSNVASGEAGAITQHIGAFRCHTAVGDICVLDTPGHEAFSAMRARGADVTDIVVLVVAGDEGLRTQTLEAIEQARSANVPIVVAINKSDKPNFNVDNVYRQLADNNLLPESWGGTTITVNCSAITGDGIKELLEMLALQAEILELKANPETRARGTVIESEMHKGLGGVATVLVQTGTLRLGDPIVFAQHWARIKTMHDEHGKELLSAGPSTPVKITGLSGLPAAGSEFIAVKTEKEARVLSRDRTLGQEQQQRQLQAKRTGLENLLQQTADAAVKKTLNLILKADVQGSLEALKSSLLKIATNKVELNIISAEVGEVSESDVQRAAASKATIIGFHTQVENHAESLIKQLKVTVKLHDIIYHAIDDVRAIMKSLLDKIPQETDTGSAIVKTIFKSSQLGVIAGCQVLDGTIKRNHLVRILRGKEIVWKGSIASLKRLKEDVREVSKGYECGILLNNYSDVKEEDIIQAYEITYLEQDL